MALKFLNKKGWHTGSLRNIENVWKAEQKHDAEQKKLEELRKQIHEERERDEFRLLQEQAGIVPRQERLEFLYDSGLSVGKGSSEGVLFKSLGKAEASSEAAPSSSAQASGSAVPGALFEDKPYSANDSWRKLHSDPLLLIRKREQEALARIKNNPVQMSMIRKSVVEKKKDKHDKKEEKRKKHRHKDSKHKKRLSSEPADSSDASEEMEKERSRPYKSSNHSDIRRRAQSDSEDELSGRGTRRPKILQDNIKHKERSTDGFRDRRSERDADRDPPRRNDRPQSRRSARSDSEHELSDRDIHRQEILEENIKNKVLSTDGFRDRRPERDVDRDPPRRSDRPPSDRYHSEAPSRSDVYRREHGSKSSHGESQSKPGSATDIRNESSGYKRRNMVPKLSEEERAARLREMQMDAELHEEQRWKRLKRADDNDAREAKQDATSRGKNFLDDVHKSVYGTAKGGSSTIEESVRRRTYYSQHRSQTSEGNAFRRI
ncbi:hypothetical protein SAY86_021029 [Trapa natans]|uniref:CBF1-interacting co-repressor CIR N-terminal domain-containing protein n=1 Tax=Trapa natans TaxID=22666 RepID=A0AAN7MJQ0_TRANT|nr:hypothetical protein SAY86_021029 [Trapa natans]